MGASEQVFQKLLQLEWPKVACTIYTKLKYVPADDDRFGHLFTNKASGFYAFFAGREVSQHIYAAILGPSKKAAKAVNCILAYNEEYFRKG